MNKQGLELIMGGKMNLFHQRIQRQIEMRRKSLVFQKNVNYFTQNNLLEAIVTLMSIPELPVAIVTKHIANLERELQNIQQSIQLNLLLKMRNSPEASMEPIVVNNIQPLCHKRVKPENFVYETPEKKINL